MRGSGWFTWTALLGAAIQLVAPPAPAQSAAIPEAAARKPAPYSLPWLLRPAAAASVVRVDQTFARYEDPASGRSWTSYLTSLTASRKLGARWAAVVRQTWVRNDAQAGGRDPSGSAFSNPLLGVGYVRSLAGGLRASGFFATALPVGGGGGDGPDPGAAAAIGAAIPARSAMDNALFAVNYWTVIGGFGLARVTPSLTAQAELSVLQLMRVRGPESQDSSRTNLTAGLHLGRFLTPRLSLGAELRLQRWISDAAPARREPAAREQFTLAAGPRLHLKVGPRSWFRPGLSYTRALDQPMTAGGYDILQIDAPFSF